MNEEVVRRQYEEDTNTVTDRPRKNFRLEFRDVRPGVKLRTVVGRTVYVRNLPKYGEYIAWKATLAAAVDEIKLEIREQHQQTRQEVHQSRRDILLAIKSSPAEYLKLICEFGSVALLFALAVRFALKIELVNTGFALFMLFSFAFYWMMARNRQTSKKRADEIPKT